MNFFHKDGRGKIVDESGKEASAFLVDPLFRLLTNLTNLQKYIKKNAKVIAEIEPAKDTDMSEVPVKKERATIYNTYSDEDRRRCFYFIQQKLMKPSEAAKAANVNYEAARKWVAEYNKHPENTKKGRVVGATKRKADGEMAPTIPKGTTSGHYGRISPHEGHLHSDG